MKAAVMIRDGKETMRLPNCTPRADGSLWCSGMPILDGLAPGGLTKAQIEPLAKARKFAEIPACNFAKLGTNPSGLVIRWADEYDAEQRAAYQEANPGCVERGEIERLLARAEKHRDYPGEYYGILAEHKRRLAAWRLKYPAEARQEDADDLRAKADYQRSLASGALTYDCDGSLTREHQQARYDEFAATATLLEKQAAELMSPKA